MSDMTNPVDRQQRLLQVLREAGGRSVTLDDAAAALGVTRQNVRDYDIALRRAGLVVTYDMNSVRIAS